MAAPGISENILELFTEVEVASGSLSSREANNCFSIY